MRKVKCLQTVFFYSVRVEKKWREFARDLLQVQIGHKTSKQTRADVKKKTKKRGISENRENEEPSGWALLHRVPTTVSSVAINTQVLNINGRDKTPFDYVKSVEGEQRVGDHDDNNNNININNNNTTNNKRGLRHRC